THSYRNLFRELRIGGNDTKEVMVVPGYRAGVNTYLHPTRTRSCPTPAKSRACTRAGTHRGRPTTSRKNRSSTMSGHCSRVRMRCGSQHLHSSKRLGTRTPKTHKRPDQRPEQRSVELLASYSHTMQAS